jgi:hypothetical protein
MGDRSLRAAAGSAAAHPAGPAELEAGLQQLELALQETARFDSLVGLRENVAKRQQWSRSERVEHLGITLPGDGGADGTLPQPRGGWDAARQVVRRLACLPGSAETRERLAAVFLTPRVCWAAPLLGPPPPDLARDLRWAVQATRTTWWCPGRWWAERVQLHPALGLALRSIRAAARAAEAADVPVVRSCMAAHAKNLRLVVVSHAAAEGLWVRPADGADPRIAEAAVAAAAQGQAAGVARPGAAPGQPAAFRADSPAGLHACRIAARTVALGWVRRSRHDAEGVEDICLDAQSHAAWRKWVGALGPDDRLMLRIWRGGAVATPTRRWAFGSGQTHCPFCEHDLASARHLWAECIRLQAARVELSVECGIAPSWWAEQPRCTAKTGWVTRGAGPDVGRRAALQVAACRLGLLVCRLGAPDGEVWGPPPPAP